MLSELINSLGETTPELKELRKQKIDIKIQMDTLETNHIKQVYQNFTIPQIKSIWKKANNTERLNILESIPEIVSKCEGLEAHGGLNYGEIMEEIIDSKWNKSYWLENMENYFESYCREEPIILKFAKVWNGLSEKEKMKILKDCNAWGYQNHNAKAKWSELTKRVQTLILVYEGIVE